MWQWKHKQNIITQQNKQGDGKKEEEALSVFPQMFLFLDSDFFFFNDMNFVLSLKQDGKAHTLGVGWGGGGDWVNRRGGVEGDRKTKPAQIWKVLTWREWTLIITIFAILLFGDKRRYGGTMTKCRNVLGTPLIFKSRMVSFCPPPPKKQQQQTKQNKTKSTRTQCNGVKCQGYKNIYLSLSIYTHMQ